MQGLPKLCPGCEEGGHRGNREVTGSSPLTYEVALPLFPSWMTSGVEQPWQVVGCVSPQSLAGSIAPRSVCPQLAFPTIGG